MKVLARVNPAYASALAKEQSTRAAIAKVTAQEQKAWTRENTLKVEATQAYKESENKGQYLKQELQNIRVEEAEYRAEEKAKEQALQDYRTGEKNAVAIAEEYAIEAQRIGERNAVAIAEDYEERMREQALQTQRLGEQYAVEIAEDYEVRERERLNAVDAARWAGVASVAQEKEKEHNLSEIACIIEPEKPKNIFETTYKWAVQNISGLFKKNEDVNKIKPLQFMERKDGRFSVAVNTELAEMKSTQYLDDILEDGFDFATGGGYKPGTLLKRTTKGVIKSSVPTGADVASPFFFNTLEYTIGDKKNEDDKVQKIILDSIVDIGGTIVAGLLAALAVLAVAGLIVLAAPLVGATVAVSAPVLLGSTLALGTVLDFGLELTDWKEPVKDNLNNWWDINMDPVISYAFNLPPPIPAQPPMPVPVPLVEVPTSTPSPEQISPREMSNTGDK